MFINGLSLAVANHAVERPVVQYVESLIVSADPQLIKTTACASLSPSCRHIS